MMTLEQKETSLTTEQRDLCLAELEETGFSILPLKLPEELCLFVLGAIDRITQEKRATDSTLKSVKYHNCVGLDRAFVDLLMFAPALELSHDVLGPVFHLNQSNFQSRMKEENPVNDFLAATGWHADGPRPAMFPSVHGQVGLHYLKFGYFLTDLTAGNGGSLQVVSGSHKRPELDGKKHADFKIGDYKDDLVSFDCEAGTIVAFHQAQWHAAPVNFSENERKNVYISYCPTWMRPLDREPLKENEYSTYTDEERFLLGEQREPLRYWLPSGEDSLRLKRFERKE